MLETMFFTGTLGEAAENLADPLLSEGFTFHGSPSGKFGVQAPLSSAQLIASNFLGVEGSDLSQSLTGVRIAARRLHIRSRTGCPHCMDS